jgi:DNA gyrase subunit A
MIATRDGLAIRFPESDVRVMGREAIGVRGIRLRGDDVVIGAGSSTEGEDILSLTEKGFGKRTNVGEYRFQSRGGFGVTNHRITEKTGPVAAVKLVRPGEDILIVTDDGTMIRVAVENISRYGRASQGVRVMRLAPGSRVIDMEKTEREEAAENTEAEEAVFEDPADYDEAEDGEAPETGAEAETRDE